MSDESKRPSLGRVLPTTRTLRAYFATRVDPLTQLYLVLPLFIVYHVGVVAQVERVPGGGYRWVGNGVDFLTGTMLHLANGNVGAYALGAIVVTLVLLALILWARRGAELHPRLFGPLLGESLVYAVLFAGFVGYVVDAVGLGVLDSQSFAAQVVSSCGAGLHEELVFRMALFHGPAWLLAKRTERPALAWAGAALASSALFSLVHYVGPLGDSFKLSTFVFRFLLGLLLAGVYRTRGFAVAAWTHTLYDILYFALRRF